MRQGEESWGKSNYFAQPAHGRSDRASTSFLTKQSAAAVTAFPTMVKTQIFFTRSDYGNFLICQFLISAEQFRGAGI